ncbi:GNAT family N-acetyltransferase [Streptomyces sp. CAU 1734]|uniref:GNAT family N-acetyltransferase n=1 Tax=Streptomyces sp. CAU 1734 TaxID=3140360 RepID=UPI0032600BE2
MTDAEPMTDAELELMQGLALRVTAIRPELVNGDASYGELAWNLGRERPGRDASRPHRFWFRGGELAAWGRARRRHRTGPAGGPVREITGASLAYQVHPGHAGLLDEVIGWYEGVAAGVDRTVVPSAADTFALERWAAHGYRTDPASLGDTGSWMRINVRSLTDVEQPVLPDGFRFRTAGEAGPEAAVRAHLDAWSSSAYTAESYRGVRRTAAYRDDLHILVEAPDGTMASSTVIWLDEVNRTAQFEPVGTHRAYRRQGLARAMLLSGMHRVRAAGATRVTVACLGAPGHPGARGLYDSVGFREFARDAPLIRTAVAG